MARCRVIAPPPVAPVTTTPATPAVPAEGSEDEKIKNVIAASGGWHQYVFLLVAEHRIRT